MAYSTFADQFGEDGAYLLLAISSSKLDKFIAKDVRNLVAITIIGQFIFNCGR